jgi:hypothetical protein
MEKEGKISKVAICENCGGFFQACHVDYLDKESEKAFTKLSNEGFTIKVETGAETRSREWLMPDEKALCMEGKCVKKQPI